MILRRQFGTAIDGRLVIAASERECGDKRTLPGVYYQNAHLAILSFTLRPKSIAGQWMAGGARLAGLRSFDFEGPAEIMRQDTAQSCDIQ